MKKSLLIFFLFFATSIFGQTKNNKATTFIRTIDFDLSYINVEVVDAKGNVVPYVDDLLIQYQVHGNGEIAGVANGNPRDVSSFQQPKRKVFHGRGLVIIRPTGKSGTIVLKATANGLKEGAISIITK